MKTSKEKVDSYVPVKISITFENPSEFNLFYDMLGFNVSVPEITCRNDYNNYDHKQQLQNMMSNIRDTMR